MSARFRIRTPQGQELSFASDEMFADFVRSGDLSDGDLVYDASTGEWSPALTHSWVMELRSEGETTSAGAEPGDPESGAAADEHGDAGSSGATGQGEGLGGIGFELAPEQSAEEAKEAFVKRLEAEREAEVDRREIVRGLKTDESGTGLLRDIDRAPPTPPSSPQAPPPSTGGDASPPARGGPPSGGLPHGGSSERKSPPKRDRRVRDAGPRRSVSGTFLVWMLILGLVGVGALFGPDVVALMGGGAPLEGANDLAEPVLADTEEALEARAEARFLGRVRGPLLALPAIPREWLDGRYLANASEYPRMEEVWTAYLEAIRGLRSGEAEHYSAAYLSALDDAQVRGATRTLRLASALSRFEREGTERLAHYARVEELASAALALHDFLLEREDRISYEPAVGPRVSVDPVLQAAAADPDTQQRLEAGLDRVLDAISARGAGPVEAAALPGWVFEGLEQAMTGA